MKIRINTNPTIKVSTLLFIIFIIIIALLLFLFSDMLPKPKVNNPTITYEITQEEEEMLYGTQQIETQKENQSDDAHSDNQSNDNTYENPNEYPSDETRRNP